MQVLIDLIELARLTPSGGNLQYLKYILSNKPKLNSKIFPCLGWARYLKDWDGPKEGERPAAYIVVLGDSSIEKGSLFDPGIASQTILLGAVEKGFGGCMIGNVNRNKLRNNLGIDNKYEILLVIALGKPNEEVIIEKVGQDNDIKYWRDDKKCHHVPKRSLEDIIIRY